MNRARSAQRKCNRRGARCCKALSLCRSTSISACRRQSRLEAVIQQADEKEGNCNHSAIMFRFAAEPRDKWTEFSEGTGRRELQLELGHLFPNVARRGPHLSGDAPPRHRLDARNRAQRVVPGARHGIARRPQAYIYVLLPMAYRVILPPLTSEFLNV